MRLTRYFLPILRDTPSEAGTVSHQLMLRAGMIRQSASGLYSWLPLGYRVLQKIEKIVHEEQQRAGAIPMLMPTIQPADLWKESGRYDDYGQEMLRIKDRHGRDLLYGPTNEEMITDIVRNSITSYRDLPKILYHIQWKFRDEVRPRFGVMRAREFLMKDAYSFGITDDKQSYNRMFVSYLRIFARMGLNAVPVRADSGPIGGHGDEFVVLAENGESQVFLDRRLLDMEIPDENIDYDDTENLSRIVFDRTIKYARTEDTHDEASFAQELEPEQQLVSKAIEVGHVFLFGDKYSKPMKGLVATHPESVALGSRIPYSMGSYGIGISRLVGALIETSHDEKGIIWPDAVAPFQAGLVNLTQGNTSSDEACEKFHSAAKRNGIEILYDDTDRRAGEKYACMELIGLPWRIAIGSRDAASGNVELTRRDTGATQTLPMDEAITLIKSGIVPKKEKRPTARKPEKRGYGGFLPKKEDRTMAERMNENRYGRFDSPLHFGPMVSIFGDVKWPDHWDEARKRQYIEHERYMKADTDNPDGPIAVLEYSLDPTDRKRPDSLKWWKQKNPNMEWPTEYPDGTPSPIPEERKQP